MKKKVVIGAAAVLLAALFIPVPKTYADGTKSYSAVAYKIIKRSSPAEDGSVYVYKDFYAFPSNFRASSKPEDVSEPAEEETTAQVADKTESTEAEKTVPETENVPESSGKVYPVFIKSTAECNNYIILKKAQLTYDKDAKAVNEIFDRYTFKTDPYDNLPDYEITIGNHKYYYESSSGIVTDSKVKKVNEEQSIVLSKTDREALNEIIIKCYESNTTLKPTTTIPNTYVYDPSDSVHYVRRGWASGMNYPGVAFIRSKAELDSYNSGDLDEAAAKYTQSYFEDYALVIVFTSESSGSNYYTGARINSAENEVVIDRYIPPVGTCDMAGWAVIIEVPASDPILTQDSAKTKVTFNNSNR